MADNIIKIDPDVVARELANSQILKELASHGNGDMDDVTEWNPETETNEYIPGWQDLFSEWHSHYYDILIANDLTETEDEDIIY